MTNIFPNKNSDYLQTWTDKSNLKCNSNTKFTCSGVPSKSLPHDKLNKVSPVKIAPDPGKQKLMWPAYN